MRHNSLVLYKNRPARLSEVAKGDRLEIELEGGETARVRPKDVVELHPGPLLRLGDLHTLPGEVHEGWEILAGSTTNLPELAELIYGTFTPSSAWSAWQQVTDGTYFEGTPELIRARSAEEVARRKLERDQADAARRAWKGFIERARRGALIPADREQMREVENLAYGRTQRSAILRELGRPEAPESAHALLLELGVWGEQVNPYPVRAGAPLSPPDLPLPPLEEMGLESGQRLDLTGIPSFAIDDEGSDTPDDAISLDGNRIWVHVADVSALVPPDSPLDLEARARGESLHLPEGTIHLFPRELTLRLGAGMQPISPALSFGIDLDDSGAVTGFTIIPSRVRVTRLSYAEAELLMQNEPFRTLERLANAVRDRRRADGAVLLDFPEVKIEAADGQVTIHPLPPLRSRALVEECMILAGSETARFAMENGLRLSFSQQEMMDTSGRPDINPRPETLAEMFTIRRLMKRSQIRTTSGRHSGLGVPAYTQVTSPLRRYLDLVNHQQLRNFLQHGAPRFDESQLMERLGQVEAVIGSLRQAEIQSEKHWTLVYLLQHSGWKGEGVLVDKRGASGIVMIPSLAMETRVTLGRDLPLDSILSLRLVGVDLPQLDARFRLDQG